MSLDEYITRVEAERGHTAAGQVRYLLKTLPAEPTPRNLDDWRTSLTSTDKSPATVNRKMAEARSYLQWATNTERLALDVDKALKVLKGCRNERKLVVLPSQDAISALLQRAIAKRSGLGSSYCLALSLGLFAGLRPGEIEALEAAHLPIGKGYAHILHTKTGAERHVYWAHSAVLSAVMPNLRANVQGKLCASAAETWFGPNALACGWPGTSRNLMRKTCASYLACSGRFSEYELLQALGHTSVVSIQHYRSPDVLGVIRQGETIEAWMGVEHLIAPLIERILAAL